MSDEHEEYLAVLKASYDYEPQSDDEIAIKEDQLLFLKERVDDDWWKVKVKGDVQADNGVVGLIPAAYVEQAGHISKVKVLYDYDSAADGELSVQEDEILLVFETEEDWILVQSQKEGGGAGFVPGNYVELYSEEAISPATRIIVPPSPPRPVSTYADPADRVASAKVTADGIKTWSVSEIDKKGKKKKGTLGIGNGALFFASESDKTPVQKWQTVDVQSVTSDKSKHINIDVGGATPVNLHFHAGSKDNVEEIISKFKSSKALSDPPVSPDAVGRHSRAHGSSSEDIPIPKKASVHFSNSSPVIIPTRSELDVPGDHEAHHTNGTTSNGNGHASNEYDQEDIGTALYDFTADGDDELSVTEGEQLIIVERDGEEWWKCRNFKGVEGVVPASYIEAQLSTVIDTPLPRSSPPPPIEAAEDGDDMKEATDEEARRRAEEERITHERERERIERAQKKQVAQRKAAAEAAELERKKRKDSVTPRVSSPPAAEPKQNGAQNRPSSSSSRPSTETNRPPADRTRIWHDRSGQFRVEAAFLGISNGKLRLHKVNGVIVEVPSEKMSIEDMKFVERLTSKTPRPPPNKQLSEDDVPLALSRPATGSLPTAARAPPKAAPKIDWFDFFLSAGCDLDDCTRYAASFEKDKLDETLLPDITEGTMRSLGVREGDIIRIKKAIERRKPTDNFHKPSAYLQDQVRRDEELARELQAQESGGARPLAPNLFSAGPGGVLKTLPRRGRPTPSKSLPPPTVDIKAISEVSDQIPRTSSPQLLSLTSVPIPVTANAPPRSSSAAPVVSGFDDDAWTNRPSSTKPLVGTPAPRAPSVPPVSAVTVTPPLVAPAPPPASAPTPASPVSGSQIAPTATATNSLAKTTEADIFDKLARYGESRKQPTSMLPPPTQTQSFQPSLSSPVVVPPSYLGMGSSLPIGQLQNTTLSVPHPSPQPYNGPRGPFAPIPSNQPLLQPLIPTNTGFVGLIPTHPGHSVSPFSNNPSPSFISHQPTGFSPTQPLMSQPTGMPLSGFNPIQGTSPFTPLQTQFTGFNPNFGQSPFNNPPPVPPLPSATSTTNNNTSPANVFAQMKSGTFATDNTTSLQPQPVNAQPAAWGQAYQGGYTGFQR